MTYWYSPTEGYHEGDAVFADDQPVPQRPDATYIWQNGDWVIGPTPVPASVTRFQALAALSNAGLLTQAQAAVNAAGGLTLLAWDNAQSFERTSPTMTALAATLSLTSAQVDSLFIAAAKIQA
jgi:hypothetical protein